MPNAKTQDSQGADIIDVVLVKLFEGPNAFPSSYVLRNSGLSIDYRARAHLKVSPITVAREWKKAKAWLVRELEGKELHEA